MGKFRFRSLLFPVILGCLLLSLFPKANPMPAMPSLETAIPASIQITPPLPGDWDLLEAGYNSSTKKYILFFHNAYKNSVSVYSRVFGSNGKPAGPLNLIQTVASSYYVCTDFVYNDSANAFLFVWIDDNAGIVYGKILDGTGKNTAAGPGQSAPTVIRPNVAGAWTYEVRAAWVPSQKQYAVAYAEYYSSATDPKNGFFMTTVDAKLKRVLDRTFIKKDITQTYPGSPTVNILFSPNTFREVNGKLLWGCPERAGGTWVKPVVWFTDLKGKVASPGMIYPGVNVKAGAEVNAAWSPTQNLIFLTWDKAEKPLQSDWAYKDNYVRLMDGRGKLVSKMAKVPRTLPIQARATVGYNPDMNRFLLIYSEHNAPSSLARALPSSPRAWVQTVGSEIQGGQLLARYYSIKGKPVGSSAAPLTETYPAASILTMPSYRCDPIAFSEASKTFFIGFLLDKSSPPTRSIWRVLYR